MKPVVRQQIGRLVVLRPPGFEFCSGTFQAVQWFSAEALSFLPWAARLDRQSHSRRENLSGCGRAAPAWSTSRPSRPIPIGPPRTFSAAMRSPALRAKGPATASKVEKLGELRDPPGRWPSMLTRSKRGLVSENAAEVRRYANGTANIAAHTQISQTRRQRSRAPAGRSTRCALQVPGIVGCTIDRVIALPVSQSHGNIRCTHQDGAGIAQQSFHHLRISLRLHIAKIGNAPCIGMAGYTRSFP